jgi:hypothetical protein
VSGRVVSEASESGQYNTAVRISMYFESVPLEFMVSALSGRCCTSAPVETDQICQGKVLIISSPWKIARQVDVVWESQFEGLLAGASMAYHVALLNYLIFRDN